MRPVAATFVALALTGSFAGVTSAGGAAQPPAPLPKEAVAFFEKYIRPVLAERCYECHSTRARKLRGGLLLDSQPGMVKGGDNGPVLVPGAVDRSRLIQAIR
jgi:hypothetical protein